MNKTQSENQNNGLKHRGMSGEPTADRQFPKKVGKEEEKIFYKIVKKMLTNEIICVIIQTQTRNKRHRDNIQEVKGWRKNQKQES